MKNCKLKKALAGLSAVCVAAAAFPAIASSAESLKLGDVDLDGEISVFDQVILRKYILKQNGVKLEGTALSLADVNKDKLVDISDAVELGKFIVTGSGISAESEEEGTFIYLNEKSAEVNGENAVVNGSTVTITASGSYYISGTIADGQILVNVPDETVDSGTVKLFLEGADITGATKPAIYIENAENTSINLMAATKNKLSDGAEAYTGDYAETAVIYAKDDFTIKGEGSLEINALNQFAVQCNNDVKFNGGTVNITTELEDAVRGKKSVTVKDGILTIDSAGDGIKSTKGDVSIEGGTVEIKAKNDAVQAETTIDISGGKITAGGDRGLTAAEAVNITGGTVVATATDNQTEFINAEQGTMLLNCIDDTSNTDGCWKKANVIAISDSIKAVPSKKFKYVLISDATIKNDGTYTLTNESTGAKVTHTNDASDFKMSGMSTVFDGVNLGTK